MARINGLLNNFNGGEISPKLRSRSDLDGYYRSSEHQRNFISEPHGEARFRVGTDFKATPVYESSTFQTASNARVIPFVYNSAEAYFLEFWVDSGLNGYMRAFDGDGDIITIDSESLVAVEKRTGSLVLHINAATPGNWTVTNPISFTGLDNDGYEQFNYLSLLPTAVNVSAYGGANREIVISGLNIGTSAAEAASGGTMVSHFNIATPYASTAELDVLQWAQKENLMYLSSGGNRQVQLVTRTAVDTFTIANFPMYSDTAGTVLTFNTASNYPRSISLHEGRLFVGGTDNNPDIVWGSNISNYDIFDDAAASPVASTGVKFQLASNNDDIVGLVSAKDFLYIQTIGGGHYLDGGSPGVAIAYNNINARRIHSVGSDLDLPLLYYDENIIFIEVNQLSVRFVDYNFDRNQYIPVEITKHAEHLCRDKVKRMVFARGYVDTHYAVTEDSSGLAYVNDAMTGTASWQRYEPGFSDDQKSQLNKFVYKATNNPFVTTNVEDIYNYLTDVCAIPTTGGTEDKVMFRSFRGGVEFYELRKQEKTFKDVEAAWSSPANASDDGKVLEGDIYEQQIRQSYLDSSRQVVFSGTQRVTFANGGALGTTTATAAGAIFSSTDVGRRILGYRSERYLTNTYAPFGVAVITSFTSSTVVDVEIQEAFETNAGGGAVEAGEYYFETDADSDYEIKAGIPNSKIAVIADGKDLGDFTADINGLVTVPGLKCSVLNWGYRYYGLIKTVNMQGGGTIGPSDSKLKNITEVGVKFRETTECKIGTNLYDLESVTFTTSDGDLDKPAPLFTGEKKVHFRETWEQRKHVYILKETSGPCNIQALVPYMEVSND